MRNGWIKLHRAVLDHWIFDSPRYLKWWMWLLLNAQRSDTRVMARGQLLEIKAGQLVASVRTLRNAWANIDSLRRGRATPSYETVRRFLKLLKNEGMVDYDTDKITKSGTHITIINYQRYQDGGGDEEDMPSSLLLDDDETLDADDDGGGAGDTRADTERPAGDAEPGGQPAAEPPPRLPEEYQRVLDSYFATERQFSVAALCKNLRVTISQLRSLAELTLAEWAQNGEAHATLKAARTHLTNTLRIKANELLRNMRDDELHRARLEKIGGGETVEQARQRMRLSALARLNSLGPPGVDDEFI